MRKKLTSISLFDAKSSHQKAHRTAVSLHCHTNYSKEDLVFIPRYASRIPIVSSFFNRERDRYFHMNGKAMDFAGWYWRPPVTVQAVFRSETERIQRQLGLRALVSLTDHDYIPTERLSQVPRVFQDLPNSLEWTVPIQGEVFHLGIHNLPPKSSGNIAKELTLYGLQPEGTKLVELLALLNECSETLVVFNHPLLDSHCIGIERLKTVVTRFLVRYGKCIHALELNGYRSWDENRATLALADQFGLPVISGGDRHGCAANTVLNLTKVATFSEFVSEIRRDKVSEVLLMPEYWKGVYTRKLESAADFFRYYPDYPHGHRRWTDRVFIQLGDGVVQPLTYFWEDTVPLWVKSVMLLVTLMGNEYLRQALRMAFASSRSSHVFLQRMKAAFIKKAQNGMNC